MNQLILPYTKTQQETLKNIQNYINNLRPSSMFRTNVSYMREMHHTHFFNPECFTCVMIVKHYYPHLMGGMLIDEYYKTLGVMNSINKGITDNFVKYKKID